MPQPSPFHVANLVAPAVDSIVHAVSSRAGQTEPQRQARADDAETLIMSFQPRDAVELMLAAQTVAFNELFADAARDVLCGVDDTSKARLLSSLVSMGRMTQGHLDRLKKRGNQPFQTAVATPEAIENEQPAVQKPPVGSRPAAAAPVAPAPAAVPDEQPDIETSWMDEPYEQWVVETPSTLAAIRPLAVVIPGGGNNDVQRSSVMVRLDRTIGINTPGFRHQNDVVNDGPVRPDHDGGGSVSRC